MSESKDVKPSSTEAVDTKLKEALEGIENCMELLKRVKRLLGVVLKGGKGYITK